jgi:uncharacterized protein (TIGR02246 family)
MTCRRSLVSQALLATGVAALISACAPPPPADTRAQDEAAIRANEVAWSAATQAKDLDKSVSFYAPDAVVLAPNEPKATTAAEIRKGWAAMLTIPGSEMTFKTSAVEVGRAGDLAYSWGTYHFAMTGPDGKPTADEGKYVTVWKKQADGSWKSVADIFNSDMPAMAPPPPPPSKGKGK